MSAEALATAMTIVLGLFPLGTLAFLLYTRGGEWTLVDIPVLFGHFSGYPAGALVAILSCGAGLAPGLAWLLTAATYGVSLSVGLGLRWSLVTVGRG